MRTALSAAASAIAATALLTGCARFAEPSASLTAQQTAERAPRTEIVGTLPPPSAQSNPGTRAPATGDARVSPEVIYDSFIVGLGGLGVLGGAISGGVLGAGKTCDHRIDTCPTGEAILFTIVSVPLMLVGALVTTLGAVQLHRDMRRR